MMLHVKVEFDAFGRGVTREIAALEIVNDLSHQLRPTYGNYRVSAFDCTGEGIAEARVVDHRRDEGVWQLIAMSANTIASVLREQARGHDEIMEATITP